MDNTVRPIEQPLELCSLMHELFMTMGALSVHFSSIAIELNLKNDRLFYLPNRQSAIRVKYLLVIFENKCDVSSIAIELKVDVQYIHSGINIVKFSDNSLRQFTLLLTFRPTVDGQHALCNKWAASWQNQQSDCAPSENSDQPGHPPSLIRVFAVR